MKIHVTQEDIQKGCRGVSTSCAVALALSRTDCNGIWSVSPDIITNSRTHPPRFHYPPAIVSEFVKNFDKGYAVSPIEFEL